MAGVTVKIRASYFKFSRSESMVADYILQNEKRVPFFSVHHIAKDAGVSVSSVIRFAKKTGYQSFKDFKLDLAIDSSSVKEIYDEIGRQDNDEIIARKVFAGNVKALQETLKIINISDLTQTARHICDKKRIVFFGIGISGLVASEAAMKLAHLDIQAEAFSDPIQIVVQSKRLRKDSMAFGISHSGRTSMTIEGLRIALNNGAVTVGLSNYFGSPLSRVSSFYLCTAFAEDRVRAAALSSHLAQLCLFDVLYLLTAKYMSKIWDTGGLDASIEELLRRGK